jgi:hypothetical protein
MDGFGSYRAGQAIDDYCRVCKMERRHTVVAADTGGRPLRVVCDSCGSQHNFRGGGPERRERSPSDSAPRAPAHSGAPSPPLALVSERERTAPPMSLDPAGPVPVDLELLLRRIIREETGLTPVVPAEKWRGGQLVLRSANAALQEKSWPIETFFHKIVMIRNRLRALEQQVNAAELPEDAKVRLQSYITGCYGSLTSFNVLFADDRDHFRGVSGD